MSQLDTRIASFALVALVASGCAEPAETPTGDAAHDEIAVAAPDTVGATPDGRHDGCPVSGHQELEIASCTTIDAKAGRYAIVEERYADLTMATIYAELDGAFVSVLSTEAYGPDEAIMAAEIAVYEIGEVPAVVIGYRHQLGAQSFDVIAWDATDLPEVVAAFAPVEGQHAAVVEMGLRVVQIEEDGHAASTLTRKGAGNWEIENHGFFEAGGATPSLASDELLAAWHDGDETAAGKVATEEAVEQLFAFAPGAAWSSVGCQLVEGAHRCGYAYEGGFAEIVVAEPTVGAFEVVGLSFAAD